MHCASYLPLQVDLLLGTWAQANVMSLTAAEMDDYEAILNCETIDIFNYISGNTPCPKRVDTPMMATLRAWALSAPLGNSPKDYAAAKRNSGLT
jgi:succinate dehydrogenase assembly factor 2